MAGGHPLWQGVTHYGRGSPIMAGGHPLWQGVTHYGRGSPIMAGGRRGGGSRGLIHVSRVTHRQMGGGG